ncbi:MAG: hypothetical protein QY327_10715 [Fimbriimonadaceae bacterium]|nr:MAG: hypothetical protein QY327_10715 [Fimbriimonadaceae bacterium]
MNTINSTEIAKNGSTPAGTSDAESSPRAFEFPQGVDPIPRRRDEDNNRFGSFFYTRTEDYGYSSADEAKLNKLLATARERGLNNLADLVEHVHDDCLVPAQRRVEELRREMARDLEALRRFSEDRERECDARELELDEAMLADLQSLLGQREAARLAALEADLKAADSFAQAGAVFDPDSPSEADLLAVRRKTVEEMAQELELPVVRDMPLGDAGKVLIAFLGLVVGVPFGISILILTGLISVSQLLSAENARTVFAISLVGGAIMSALGGACGYAFRVAGHATFSRAPKLSRGLLYSLAFTILIICLAVESSVEVFGLLKLSSVSSRIGEQSLPLIMMLCVGLVFAFGFLVVKSYLGYLHGQRLGVDTVISGNIDRDLQSRTQERRERPQVKQALQDLAEVRAARQTLAEHDGRILQRQQFHARRSQRNEARRIPFPFDYSPTQKMLLEEAIDRIAFPNHAFLQAREQLERALEIQPGLFKRLARYFRKKIQGNRQKVRKEKS